MWPRCSTFRLVAAKTKSARMPPGQCVSGLNARRASRRYLPYWPNLFQRFSALVFTDVSVHHKAYFESTHVLQIILAFCYFHTM